MIRPLAWGNHVSLDFTIALRSLILGLNWTPGHADWLMSAMAFESGETFSPSVKNGAGSGATGLIQFMPATARGLGTTTAALGGMNAVDQLVFVKQYFKPYASRVHTLSDLYMAILLPSAIGEAEDAVLFDEGILYRQNAGLDANHDGEVTKAEAASQVMAKLVKGLRAGNTVDIDWGA